MRFFPLLSVSLILITGCSGPERHAFNPAECNPEGGYNRGYIEGRNGFDPDTNYSSRCKEEMQANVRKGYQHGYRKGRQEYQKMISENSDDENQAPTPVFSCEIKWKGRGFEASAASAEEARTKVVDQCAQSLPRKICGTLPQCKNEAANTNPKAFYCSITVFNNKYDSFGPTKIEAQSALKKTCATQEKDGFFCNESKMSCKKNQ